MALHFCHENPEVVCLETEVVDEHQITARLTPQCGEQCGQAGVGHGLNQRDAARPIGLRKSVGGVPTEEAP